VKALSMVPPRPVRDVSSPVGFGVVVARLDPRERVVARHVVADLHRAASPQSALVHINTTLLQRILAEPTWSTRLIDADRRALTPLFWTHVNPYGKFTLDMDTQLDLDPPHQGLATA